MASTGFAGFATAGGREDEDLAAADDALDGRLVFCGCGQLCACINGYGDVLVADRSGGDWEFHRVRRSWNVCVTAGEPDVPDGKIIALQVGGTRWVNPNACAERALAAEREHIDSTHPRPEGERGGSCGKPPCEHPGRRGGRGPPDSGGDPDRGESGRGRGNDNGHGPPEDAGNGHGPPEDVGKGRGPRDSLSNRGETGRGH